MESLQMHFKLPYWDSFMILYKQVTTQSGYQPGCMTILVSEAIKQTGGYIVSLLFPLLFPCFRMRKEEETTKKLYK